MMKKTIVIVLVILAVVGLFIGLFVGSYNTLVEADENANEKFATVDTMLTRRADLIPNLVSTVKGYAAHEEEIYTALADARAKLAGSTTAEETLEANTQLESALSRLLVVVENYPDLKASEQFKGLQDQLEGAENRIATARVDYNEAVTEYNKKIRRFPASIIAGMFGFERKALYEAPQSDLDAPTVEF